MFTLRCGLSRRTRGGPWSARRGHGRRLGIGLYGGGMASWWHRDVIAPGKLPLMLCFLAFVVTFVVTRTITRMIRDGRGPFRNQVTAGGTHIHHSVPGIILLIIGAFTAVGGPDSLGWRSFAAVAVGIGTSLVLDEFALILHLQDVYWSGEGQLSVEAVSLTAACLGLALVGFSPFGITDIDNIELTLRLTATGILVADGVLSFICVLKGKYRTALFGLFLPLVGLIGAVRLARPSSIWARHRYRGERLDRATRRAADFDRRWAPLQSDWENFVGGRPSQPNPAPPIPRSRLALADLLGQGDDDARGAAEVAEQEGVLELGHLAEQLGAVGAQAGDGVMDVVDREHDPVQAQRVRRRARRLGRDRRRGVVLGQLQLAVTVGRPHHRDLAPDAVESDG